MKLIQSLGPKGVRFGCKNEYCFGVKQKKKMYSESRPSSVINVLVVFAGFTGCLFGKWLKE